MSNPDPSYDEMREFIKEVIPCSVDEFDEMDVAEAIYAYATAYHSGQWSNLYEAITLSQFTPGAYYTGLSEDSGALDIYTALCEHYGEPIR